MWHLHILDPRRYEDMCSKLPPLIHHNPDGGHDAAARRKRYEATLFAYRARFGEAAQNAIWPHHLYQNGSKVFLIVKTPAGKKITIVADQSWCIEDVKFVVGLLLHTSLFYPYFSLLLYLCPGFYSFLYQMIFPY